MSTRHIHTVDDIVPLVARHAIYTYVTHSRFVLGWEDSADMAKSGYKNLYSTYTRDEVSASGFGEYLAHPRVAEHLEGYVWEKCVINLSTPSDINFTHTHPCGQRIVLYYVNLEWKTEWYGETMFLNETDDSIMMAARYTPGRILVFDGAIPHSIRPQSSIGPQYRFTMTNVFTPST